jgi:hypothetical protein
VFVQFSAPPTVTMVEESVIVKKDGRDLNVIFLLPNVKCQLAQIMVDVLKGNVIVRGAGRDQLVVKVIFMLLFF